MIRERLDARAGEDYDLFAETINPLRVKVWRTIGFDRTWARAEGQYLYDTDELQPWSERIAQLADHAHEVHVLMNNCYQDYGVRNATDLIDLLHEAGAEDARVGA